MSLDLREWLEETAGVGELKVVEGADWEVELGAIAELIRQGSGQPPALLFDKIKNYPPGFRVLTNSLCSRTRLALTARLPRRDYASEAEIVQDWRDLEKKRLRLQPVYVEEAPFMENVMEGEDIDLFRFPAPLWHEHDGGRYIGTGSITVTRDPDDGWVNVGTYRVMLQGKREVGFFIVHGRDGYIQRRKYFERGEACPVAISFGHHPLFLVGGNSHLGWGKNEYEYLGGLIGEPVEVFRGPLTGLPIPAQAEIVIEGEAFPGDMRLEGPFGEYTGYYASGSRPEPYIRVKKLYYRNNPVILGSPPSKPPSDSNYFSAVTGSAYLWNGLEEIGIPGIKGVWRHSAGANRMLLAVSIKQAYPGHAKQAALLASQYHAYMGRFMVVVDEDIDPYNLKDLVWAVCTRCDPAEGLDIIRRSWGSPVDPLDRKKTGLTSEAIIDACKPYEWLKDFPATVEVSPEKRKQILEKWPEVVGV